MPFSFRAFLCLSILMIFRHFSHHLFLGVHSPSDAPHRSQYLIILLTIFLFALTIVFFKTLVNFLDKHRNLFCAFPIASVFHQSVNGLIIVAHQHSPAFFMMNAGTSLPVARHKQTHLAIQRFHLDSLMKQMLFAFSPSSDSRNTLR